MIASKYKISAGIGIGESRLVSFDEALLNAEVGNYNLVRLSSILPAGAVEEDTIGLPEGSLLPIAYATITSNKVGNWVASAVAIGFPADESKVGVIMEYSEEGRGARRSHAVKVVEEMVVEAFRNRDWQLKEIVSKGIECEVDTDGEFCTTFACVAEWEVENGKTEN